MYKLPSKGVEDEAANHRPEDKDEDQSRVSKRCDGGHAAHGPIKTQPPRVDQQPAIDGVEVVVVQTLETHSNATNDQLRLVLLAPRHHQSTPLLEKLHWLPISERIKYNVTCMCFNAIIMSFTNCIQTHEMLKRTFNTTRRNVQIFRVSPFYKQQQLNGEQWNIGHLPCFRMLAVILVSNLCFQRMHLWQSLRTLHLHASQARVVVGDSASLLLYLCCVFQALINSLACWFCTSALGLVLFLISVFPIY